MVQVQTYLSDILHIVAQWLLVPDILLLLIFIGYALFCIGSLIVELVTERKHFKVVMPKFLNALMEAPEDGIPAVVEESGLLKRQKQALMTVYENRKLPGDALLALVKREVEQEESRYDSITGRNNMAARVAPMLGLMGTLIPLGPGVEALGRADTAALSSSLLVAFDTTVAGLVVAAVCLVIGKIRGNWYDDYLSALDAGMATMMEKVEGMRAAPNDIALFLDGRTYELAHVAQPKGAVSEAALQGGGGPVEPSGEPARDSGKPSEAIASDRESELSGESPEGPLLPSIESFIHGDSGGAGERGSEAAGESGDEACGGIAGKAGKSPVEDVLGDLPEHGFAPVEVAVPEAAAGLGLMFEPAKDPLAGGAE